RDNTPTFDGTADDGAVVTLYGSAAEGDVVLGSATSTGSWSITVGVLADGSYSVYAVEVLGGIASGRSTSRGVVIDTVAPDAPVLDLPAAEDSGYWSSDDVTSINYWHFMANTAGEPAFGYLHELSPNGRSSTGGAYDANAPGWGFVGSYAPYADGAGGLGSDGRQGGWTYTAWV